MNEKELKALFPGVEVPLECGLNATVYPLGVTHLKKFSKQITRVFAIFAAQKVDANIDAKSLAIAVVPTLLEEAMDLIQECTTMDIPFERLPHWELPKLAEAWVIESFGEEHKFRPWVEVIQKAAQKAGVNADSISEMLSNFSSPQDTPSSQSLSTDKQTSHTVDGLSGS